MQNNSPNVNLLNEPPDNPDDVDQSRRQFLFRSIGVLSGVSVLLALTPLISSWFPSVKTKSKAGPVRVDLSHLAPGQQMTIAWRGKPIWIIRRTQAMLNTLSQHDNQLRDPNSLVQQQPPYASNPYRSIHPEYLVLVGLCTHLACSPRYMPTEGSVNPAWSGGFYCPCHGSTFDLAGRVFKGVPAPINLEVPPYRFESAHVIVIGESGAREG